MIFVSKVNDDDTVEIIDTSDGVKERISKSTALSLNQVILGISDGVVSEYPLEEAINTGIAIRNVNNRKFPYKCEGTTLTECELIREVGTVVDVVYGVQHIGSKAFERQTVISTVNLPNTLLTIGDEAFSLCSSIKNITLTDGIKSIGKEAFSACGELENIVIPDSVTELGAGAFNGCTNLKSIKLSSNLTMIRSRMFAQCEQLTEIEITDGMEMIGCEVFNWCDNLRKVTIPDSVKYIDEYAFEGCSAKPTIYCSSNSYAAEFAKKNGLSCVYI